MFKIVDDIPIWGDHDAATLAQIQRCARDEQVAGAALMADGHKGYSMPIGGVIAYRNAVSPSGVGYDISCGNKAARTDIRAEALKPDIQGVMDQIARTVVFGIGQTSGKAADHALFDDPTWRDLPQLGRLRQLAREQLGTVGSGNHYCIAGRPIKVARPCSHAKSMRSIARVAAWSRACRHTPRRIKCKLQLVASDSSALSEA